MMDINRDVADFKRRAEIAYAAMRTANGRIAAYCCDDARFYLQRAIEIASATGRKDTVARLRLRRWQIMETYKMQQGRIPPQQHTGIERWENEGGAIGA